MNINCTGCNKQYDGREAITRRPAPDQGEGVDQYILTCPHCKAEKHVYYTNADIERRQQLVRIAADHMSRRKTPQAERRFRQAQEDLRRKFDVLNPSKVEAATQ